MCTKTIKKYFTPSENFVFFEIFRKIFKLNFICIHIWNTIMCFYSTHVCAHAQEYIKLNLCFIIEQSESYSNFTILMIRIFLI